MAEPSFVERIAVVGGGTVALLAALALARALPRSTVMHVPSAVPDEAMADHAVSGEDALQALHRRLGIAEQLLLARAGASHWLATCYRGFGARPEFLVGHGAAPRDEAGGFAAEPSLAALLAAEERFLAAEQDGGDAVDPLLRFAPDAYREGLAILAGQAGVRRTPYAAGPAAYGGVALVDGTVLHADLLIDATGCGWLRDAQGPAAWVNWHGHDQLVWGARLSVPAAALPSLCDTITACDSGYLVAQPGRHAMFWTALWAGSDAEAPMLRSLAAASGAAPGAPFRIRPGRRTTPWQGKVLAIGDSAARFAPLGSGNLHLAAAQISLLLELLPSGTAPFAEAGEYNRRASLLIDDAHDFVRCQQGGAGSAALAQRIDQFRRRGWVPALSEGLIAVDRWSQLLMGLGHGPGVLPRARAIPQETLEGMARQRHQQRSAQLELARPYAEWIAARHSRKAGGDPHPRPL
ncbi:tryptophan 7-halogenase [Sphingomonas pituitosa]|uniref:tryptophan 7-halogenase n=1 Tax=Sphingomonas pituitosa TaxID=99597 RepID=UPI00082C984C|nr:tryptophan 7-halogenase [Sphingomonas pituitosa]